jgi:GT2 family glycosyltransferase/glycosyltransferase involved in cell wall biosynthesis
MSSKSALICSYYIPQTDLDSYSRRLFHLLEFLREAGWRVTVLAQMAAESAGSRLRHMGVPVYLDTFKNAELLADRELFDLAILGFWHIAEPIVPVIRRVSPATRIIVDSGDIHLLRHARRIFRSRSQEGRAGQLDSDYAAAMIRELNTYAGADAVLAVSQKEADLIADMTADATFSFAVPDCEDLAPSKISLNERKGMVFVGNFEHPPNLEALHYFCEQILPRVPESIRKEHPAVIIGNDLKPSFAQFAEKIAHVRIIGWVPSVIPYIERARIAVVPLLHGAGTKRKLLQALAIGTPAVSTSVGTEGLSLRNEENVLIADDPDSFAREIARLASDRQLWQRLKKNGRAHLAAQQGRKAVGQHFLKTVELVLAREQKKSAFSYSGEDAQEAKALKDYQNLVERIRQLADRELPANSQIAVVSKGDHQLLRLNKRPGWHFPQNREGVYAGYHPANSAEAINQLQMVEKKGADWLLFPKTAFWWFEHYAEFRQHLDANYSVAIRDAETCVLYALSRAAAEFTATRLKQRPPPETKALPPSESAAPAEPAASKRAKIKLSAKSAVVDLSAISVIIPTLNRASLLESSLQSLAQQSLEPDKYEVVVIDDGSTDHTDEVAKSFSSRFTLKYVRTLHGGIAAAKNVGVHVSRHPIVFFFDDDDIADRHLLREHLRSHQEYSDETIAILGYTIWARSLRVTELMHFITGVGHYLFSYKDLEMGQPLDFTYFWGGRTSCKRSFLERHGFFDEQFHFGSEDIELSYRLSHHGLGVILNRCAVQYMNRGVTYDEFCRRCERQGRSQFQFSQLYSDQTVQTWCGVTGAQERWQEHEPLLAEKVAMVHETESLLKARMGVEERAALINELHKLYWWTFDTFKLKGIVEKMNSAPQEEEHALTSAGV